MPVSKDDPEIASLLDEETAGLKNANAELKSEKSQIKQELDRLKAQMQQHQEDLAELAEIRKEREEAESKKTDYESQLKRLQTQQQKDADARKAREATLMQALETHLLDSSAAQAIASENGIPVLLMPHLKSRMAVEEVDGKFEVRIRDAAGNITDGTIQDLVKEYKGNQDFAGAFKSSITPGGNAKAGVELSSTVNPYAKETFNLSRQGELERTNPTLAARMQAEAGY